MSPRRGRSLKERQRLLEEFDAANPRPRLQRLVRVVPGPDPDRDFRVLGIEFYSDGLVIRWRGAQGVRADLNLTDNIGTVYKREGGMGGSCGDEPERHLDVRAPAVPGAATRLTIRRGDHSVEVVL